MEHMAPALVEIEGVVGRITLENVYLNGLHALKRITLRNRSSELLVANLSSDLEGQIGFQLQNENILTDETSAALAASDTLAQQPQNDGNPDTALSVKDGTDNRPSITSNTPAASSLVHENTNMADFNELFNYVDFVHQVHLLPHQSKDIILSFLPSSKEQKGPTFSNVGYTDERRHDGEASKEDDSDHQALQAMGEDDDELHYSSDVSGIIKLSARPLNDQSEQTYDALHQTVSYEFHASVCRSVMWCDISEIGLDFDDCIVGGTYFKDFTIWNRSEIELYWTINTLDVSVPSRQDWLRFTDYDTGEVTGHEPIGGFSFRRIRVTFKPKDIGDFTYHLQLENLNDAHNIVSSPLHATVRAVHREESLLISTGNTLDFSDCCAGIPTKRELVIKNMSDQAMEIHLATEDADVTYEFTTITTQQPTDSAYFGIDSESRDNFSVKWTSELTAQRSAAATDASDVVSDRLSQSYRSPSIQSSSRYYEEGRGRKRMESGTNVADSDDDTYTDSAVTPNDGAVRTLVTKIEDMALKPGSEKTINVLYTPKKDQSAAGFKAGQLLRKTFKIIISYGLLGSTGQKNRKTIQCKARACTSFVEVSPRILNFGDTDVGTLKSLPIHIYNRAELTARVRLDFTSKILNCYCGEIVIPPLQSIDVKLDMYPRKVNPEYRKQLKLINLQNRDDDHIIEVRSTNIDKNRVTFHSLFYRILTATGANYLDFGSLVLNSPAIRIFTVDNISPKRLGLNLATSSPSEIKTYVVNRSKQVNKEDHSHTNNSQSNAQPNINAHAVSAKDRFNPLPKQAFRLGGTKQEASDDTWDDSKNVKRQSSGKVGAKRLGRSNTTYLDLASDPAMTRNSRRHAGQKPVRADGAIQTTFRHAVLNRNSRSKHRRSSVTFEKEAGSRLDGKAVNITSGHRLNPERSSSEGIVTANQLQRRPIGLSGLRAHSRRRLIQDSSSTGETIEGKIIKLERQSTKKAPIFANVAAEEKYVRSQLKWREDLQKLVTSNELKEVGDVLVEAESEEDVIVVYTPSGDLRPNIQGIPKKVDAKLFLRLVEFDRDIEQTQFDSLLKDADDLIPVRELLMRSSISRSVMSLGQKNINFGICERNERRTRSIVIRNRSELPLLYAFKKSGSIASSDISIEGGRYGIVRSFARKEVEFIFEPTLHGTYFERLAVQNVQDGRSEQVISVKAQIRKPPTFEVRASDLEFGICPINSTSSHRGRIVLTNTTTKNRTYIITYTLAEEEQRKGAINLQFVVADDATMSLSKEAEEELEHLEQKLKIAQRKGQEDKVTKYEKKLQTLRPPSSPQVNQKIESPLPASYDEHTNDTVQPDPSSTINVDGSAKKTVEVRLHCSGDFELPQLQHEVCGTIVIHELKNMDYRKSVSFSVIPVPMGNHNLLKSKVQDRQASKLTRASSLSTRVPTISPSLPKALIFIETPDLDVGRLEFNVTSSFYLKLCSSSELELSYKLLADEKDEGFFQFEEPHGTLAPHEHRKVFFKITPVKLGRQSHSLTLEVRDPVIRLPYSIRCVAHRPKYLQFPSLGDDANDQLDLGFCYVDSGSKYSQVTPLLVQNVTDDDIYISCQSNLTHQVCVFLDEAGERGQVVNTLLRRRAVMTVWVALQPSLLGGLLYKNSSNSSIQNKDKGRGVASTGNDKDQELEDECRTLVGGLKFSVYTSSKSSEAAVDAPQDDMDLMLSQTVKFTSLIGQSHLAVSHSIIHLGYTTHLEQTFYGAFSVTNLSGRLPLDYFIECLSGNIFLDHVKGTLDGWNIKQDPLMQKKRDPKDPVDVTTRARSKAQITFRLTPVAYGLFQERIVVHNLNNSEEVFDVTVTLLVDDNRLLCTVHDVVHPLALSSKRTSICSFYSNSSDLDVRNRDAVHLPLIEWKNIPLAMMDSDENHTLRVIETMHDNPLVGSIYPLSRRLTITNVTSEPLSIFASSDLTIAVRTVNTLQLDSRFAADTNASNQGYKSAVFTLEAGQRLELDIRYPWHPEIADEYANEMHLGRRTTLSGVLSFIENTTLRVLKLYELKATFCESIGVFDRSSLDLGKAGYTNNWADIPFDIPLRNQSEVPLLLSLEYSDVCSPSLTDELRDLDESIGSIVHLDALAEDSVACKFSPKLLRDGDNGDKVFKIRARNLMNPRRDLEFHVHVHVAGIEMQYERLVDGEIILPTLNYPLITSDVACDAWFSVWNPTDEDVRIEAAVETEEDIADLLTIDALSRFSNSPLKGGIPVPPNGKLEIRVRARPRVDKYPSMKQIRSSTKDILLGSLLVTARSQYVMDTSAKISNRIPIRGSLQEVPIFNVTKRHLEYTRVITTGVSEDPANLDAYDNSSRTIVDSLMVPKTDAFQIINISDSLSLSWNLDAIECSELRPFLQLFSDTLDGSDILPFTVPPRGKLSLRLDLSSLPCHLSGNFNFKIRDRRSPTHQGSTIKLTIREERRLAQTPKLIIKDQTVEPSPRTPRQDGEGRFSPPSYWDIDQRAMPVMVLKGCKRLGEQSDFGGRYALDLGQQDQGSNIGTRKLILENREPVAVSYSIKIVGGTQDSWFQLNRTEGTIDAIDQQHGSPESATITLSFQTNSRNVYCSYLVITNVNNPADTKTVRLTMEAARQNLRRGLIATGNEPARVFDVFVNGVDTKQSSIEMLNLYYGAEYTARCMVIYNRESVPLEFSLMTNLPHDDPSEIVFSTSRMAPKLFKSLTIGPHENVRIYIRFRPLPTDKALFDGGNAQIAQDAVELKRLEIYVNCRLVKDYQQIIVLEAECRQPAFRIQYPEFESLMGSIHRLDSGKTRAWDVTFDIGARNLEIDNLLDDVLEYEIANDTMYFSLEYEYPSKTIPGQSTHVVRVVPNISAIKNYGETLWREKYVQEYITIYNKQRPDENYWVPLRLSFGHIANFQLAYGYRTSFAYNILEDHIVKFLTEFSSNKIVLAMSDLDESAKSILHELKFRYHYIVDQLVYHSTVRTGETFLQLANLLFGVLLNDNLFMDNAPAALVPGGTAQVKIWPPALAKWVFAMHYYLSFFPYRPAALEYLRRLHQKHLCLLLVLEHICQTALAAVLTIMVPSHENTSTASVVGALTSETGDLAGLVNLVVLQDSELDLLLLVLDLLGGSVSLLLTLLTTTEKLNVQVEGGASLDTVKGEITGIVQRLASVRKALQLGRDTYICRVVDIESEGVTRERSNKHLHGYCRQMSIVITSSAASSFSSSPNNPAIRSRQPYFNPESRRIGRCLAKLLYKKKGDAIDGLGEYRVLKAGIRVALTTENDEYEREAAHQGYVTTFVPVLEHALVNIEELKVGLRAPAKYASLILTSQRSAEALAEAFNDDKENNAWKEEWREKVTYVIGNATAKAAQTLGLKTTGSTAGKAACLAPIIIEQYSRTEPLLPLLFLVGDKRLDVLPQMLNGANIPFQEIVTYETRPHRHFSQLLQSALSSTPDWIVFFSPSGFDVALPILSTYTHAYKVATIGPTTAQRLKHDTEVHAVAAKPDAASLVRAIVRYDTEHRNEHDS
ncbi:hypothetical protein BZG36_01690 [Bifiguratus adelaidae]|uniref:Uroporphyrinogen-III synthase n=1 Tax=Bifiguratus adelaidae TaxID=1938954 RepID=A0A261Y512_9FUNG|nr:hypothetical protein BZG36_01690 [Bifiguratus adelaidae]